MASVDDILKDMRNNPAGIKFKDLCKVCDLCFGEARQASTSHRVYKMPWRGNPRVNIPADKGMAKDYQVRQVVKAIDKLQERH